MDGHGWRPGPYFRYVLAFSSHFLGHFRGILESVHALLFSHFKHWFNIISTGCILYYFKCIIFVSRMLSGGIDLATHTLPSSISSRTRPARTGYVGEQRSTSAPNVNQIVCTDPSSVLVRFQFDYETVLAPSHVIQLYLHLSHMIAVLNWCPCPCYVSLLHIIIHSSPVTPARRPITCGWSPHRSPML